MTLYVGNQSFNGKLYLSFLLIFYCLVNCTGLLYAKGKFELTKNVNSNLTFHIKLAFMSRQSSLCKVWGTFKFTFFMGSFLPDSGTIPGEAIMVPLPPSTATCNKIRLDLKKLRKNALAALLTLRQLRNKASL